MLALRLGGAALMAALAACGQGAVGQVPHRTLGRVGSLSPQLTSTRTASGFSEFLMRGRAEWRGEQPPFGESLVLFVPSEGGVDCLPDVSALRVRNATEVSIEFGPCPGTDGVRSDAGVGTTWVLSVACSSLPSARGEFSAVVGGRRQAASWDCS